jgi:hypothetical protein
VIAAKLDAQPVIIPAWSIGDQRLKVLNCSCTAKLGQGTAGFWPQVGGSHLTKSPFRSSLSRHSSVLLA